MKILLLQTYNGKSEFPVFPLGLSYLVGALGNYEIKVFDPNISDSPFDGLSKLLLQYRPKLIGISIRNIDSTNKRRVVFFYEQFKRMLDVVGNALGRDTKIVVGGPGFSMFAQTIMKDEPRIDFGIFGEAEDTFPNLLNSLDKPELVPGIYYRKNGSILFSGSNHFPALDSVAVGKRFQIDPAPYLAFPDAIGVETKRGCALNCIYCIYGFLNGKRYRLRDPVQVVDEIVFLAQEKGIDRFTFVDSVFNVPIEHSEAICSELIKRNLDVSWSAWFHDKYITEAFARLAQKAGCHKFILSPDGFSDTTLKILDKSLNKKDIFNALAILKKLEGVEISYNFFKNPPGQTLSNFLSLLYFCFRTKLQLRQKVHFEFSSIRIEPNTELHKMALKENIISEEENLLFPVSYTNYKTRYIEHIFDFVLKLRKK